MWENLFGMSSGGGSGGSGSSSGSGNNVITNNADTPGVLEWMSSMVGYPTNVPSTKPTPGYQKGSTSTKTSTGTSTMATTTTANLLPLSLSLPDPWQVYEGIIANRHVCVELSLLPLQQILLRLFPFGRGELTLLRLFPTLSRQHSVFFLVPPPI